MSDETPPLRVVKGEPTAEELAALVAVVAARSAESEPETERPSTWASYWRRVRTPLRPGRDAWRSSALPQ